MSYCNEQKQQHLWNCFNMNTIYYSIQHTQSTGSYMYAK